MIRHSLIEIQDHGPNAVKITCLGEPRCETWNADNPTRHDLDSALNAVDGKGLTYSAAVIRNYIKALEDEIERLVKGD